MDEPFPLFPTQPDRTKSFLEVKQVLKMNKFCKSRQIPGTSNWSIRK